MSKYDIKDKFIIKIGHIAEDDVIGSRYYIKGFDTLVFDDKGLDRLEEYDTSGIEDTAYHQGYLRGLNDAWETAKKIVLNRIDGGLYDKDLIKIFSVGNIDTIFKSFNVFEAVKRVERYQESYQTEFEVGEEVVDSVGFKYFITAVDEHTCRLVNSNGYDVTLEKGEFVKTGKKYDITSILKEMKESEAWMKSK